MKPAAGGGVRKHWVQRVRVRGQETNIGLGAWPVIGLAVARQRALANAQFIAAGGDPRHTAAVPSFQEAAEEVIKTQRKSWRDSGRSEAQWRSSLATYVFPVLGEKSVAEITSRDVHAVLEPIWSEKPETARRVRGRISAIMEWAVAKEHREHNPAGDAIRRALGPHKTRPQHHRALHHSQVPAAIAAVHASEATPSVKLAIEFLTLTACRSGEVRGCRWDEIDLAAATWTVPPSRTKTGMEHRVALSGRAVEVLNAARKFSGGVGLVFPSPTGKELSDSTMSKLMKELGLDGTPHGMRAAFRSWCSDTAQPRELAEQALGHAVGGVEGAYARSDMLERRRAVMKAWADHLKPAQT